MTRPQYDTDETEWLVCSFRVGSEKAVRARRGAGQRFRKEGRERRAETNAKAVVWAIGSYLEVVKEAGGSDMDKVKVKVKDSNRCGSYGRGRAAVKSAGRTSTNLAVTRPKYHGKQMGATVR